MKKTNKHRTTKRGASLILALIIFQIFASVLLTFLVFQSHRRKSLDEVRSTQKILHRHFQMQSPLKRKMRFGSENQRLIEHSVVFDPDWDI